MKITFKIFGALLLLATGAIFGFYGLRCYKLSKAEKAYNYGDFETATALHEEEIKNLGKQPISKIPSLRDEVEKINLIQAWGFYCQGYYVPEKYDLAEKIANQEIEKEKSIHKDQFYNLQALICWQKGVELFIKLGKKAANLKELGRFIEETKTNSQEAVNFSNGKDWDIKYNWEFFRKDKRELKKNMQQQAQQKQKDREMKGKMEQMAKEKKIKSNQEERVKNQQKQEEKRMKKDKENKEKIEVLTPEKKKEKSEEETSQATQKKKKKKKG